MSFELPIKTTLTSLGKTFKSSGENFLLAQCPFHQDSQPSFSINILTGKSFCFTCGASADISFYTNSEQDLESMQRQALYASLKPRVTSKKETVKSVILPPKEEDVTSYRGVDNLLDVYKCSVGKFAGRLIFPITNDEELVGYTGRDVEGNSPKYLHNLGFCSQDTLYPDPALQTGTVAYLVEGVMDALSLWQEGYCAYANFGLGTPSLKKITLLLKHGVEDIVVFMDDDAAGDNARERIEGVLKPYFNIIKKEYTTPYQQIVEAGVKDYNEFICKGF